jgi:hypothetical protein
MRATPGEVNAPTAYFNEEDHLQGLQHKRFNREEITCQKLGFVVRQ